MPQPKHRTLVQYALLAVTAAVCIGARVLPARGAELLKPTLDAADAPAPRDGADRGLLEAETEAAIDAFAAVVRPLSHPMALEDAFHSYFAFKAAHPDKVRKPYLYFVDYGLPSTRPRGYVLDMDLLRVIAGPFAVAHGRGSARARYGVPTRFSNAPGSEATSLGLYLAGDTYGFVGHSGGRTYRSIGLRLIGVSDGFNDNALERGVVAHGAPYVTATKAGRSEGCPAMEQARARRLLPKLADGGMVFLFAPDEDWMSGDPWLAQGE